MEVTPTLMFLMRCQPFTQCLNDVKKKCNTSVRHLFRRECKNMHNKNREKSSTVICHHVYSFSVWHSSSFFWIVSACEFPTSSCLEITDTLQLSHLAGQQVFTISLLLPEAVATRIAHGFAWPVMVSKCSKSKLKVVW